MRKKILFIKTYYILLVYSTYMNKIIKIFKLRNNIKYKLKPLLNYILI